jgi:hypothetical protein
MIKKLLARLLILAALFIPQLSVAEETLPSVSIEVVQQLPVLPVGPSPFWEGLDGRASLVGGEITTSRGQFDYAQRMAVPVITTDNKHVNITAGQLVLLEGPNLRMKSSDVIPYVRPETKNFIVRLAFDYGQAGCGQLVITSALRVMGSKMPSAASIYSVHTRGMAADVKVNGISEHCEAWLNDYLLAREAEMVIDATREHWKMVRGRKVPNPHFHIVAVPVPPTQETTQLAVNP